MSEFRRCQKIFGRMCHTYGDKPDCEGCPFRPYHDGNDYIMCVEHMIGDPETAEQELLEWDKTHPELHYPSWWTLLEKLGIFDQLIITYNNNIKGMLQNTEISEDVALRFNIEKTDSTWKMKIGDAITPSDRINLQLRIKQLEYALLRMMRHFCQSVGGSGITYDDSEDYAKFAFDTMGYPNFVTNRFINIEIDRRKEFMNNEANHISGVHNEGER